ncbi:MAG: hypothetical protein V2A64_05310 [Candidatus Omnitrophota bacterium]
MMIKKLSIICAIGLFAFLVPHILTAGGIKEKVQQRINAPNKIQFQNEFMNTADNNMPCSEPLPAIEQTRGLEKRNRDNRNPAKPRDIRQDLSQVQVEIEEITAPPVFSSYAIYKTDYKADIEEDVVTVKGKILFEVFKKGWTQLPIVRSSVGLIDVSINRGTSFVIAQGDKYYLMIDKPGRYNLDLEFLIKASRERENGPGNFNFEILSAPISQFEFMMPETGVEIFVDPAIKVELKKEANKTTAWAVLPNTNAISVRWSKALPKETIAKVKLEPKLFLDTAAYVSVGEGIIRCQTSLNYSILQSEVSNLRLALPEDLSILDVQCKDLRDWKTSVKEGTQYLDVYFNFGIKGNYSLNLSYERKIAEGSSVVEIPWIRGIGVEREKGYFGLAAATNVELEANKIEHASLIDVKELPSSIWSSTTNPILLAFKYVNHPFNIAIEVTKHAEVPVLVAAIDSAEYTSLQTDEGKNLTKAVYQIRNNVKQFLRLVLPKQAVLWSVFVTGRPVKPAKDKNGSILIPLEKSRFERESLTQFPVEIVYLDNTPKMRWLGSLKLCLPKVDIPVSKLNWEVYLPVDYNYFNFDGDIKESKQRLYERMWTTESKKLEAAKDKMGYLLKESQTMGMGQSEQFAGQTNSTLTGTLPIRIDVPTQGRLYLFSKLLVTENENPWITMKFIYNFRKFHGRLAGLLILTGICALAAIAIKKKKE